MMECFGNPHSSGLPDDALLRLNAVDISTLEKGYVIANGTKINMDVSSAHILEQLGRREVMSLSELLAEYNLDQQVKAKTLINQITMLDVLEVIGNKS